MLNEPEKIAENTAVEIRCYFVRKRNALAARGQFGTLYMDYYLHLMQHRLPSEPVPDQWLKDGLAALTLHLASRPWNEAAAWTVNLQDPLMNLFVTGSNRQANVTGRFFTDGVKESESSLFYSQTSKEGVPERQSTVEFDTADDFFQVIESYYRQSEQRPARFFRYDEEDFVMVSAHPDYDRDWLAGLDDEAIRTLDDEEDLSLLEVRKYRFDCGCDVERIYPIIAGLSAEMVDELFAGQEKATANCPRCGASFELNRSELEAFTARKDEEKS